MRQLLSKINFKKIYFLGLELFIVFAGVYAAFLLDDFKTQQRNKTKKIQIYESLFKQALQDSVGMCETFSMLDSLVITPYTTAHDKGLMPDLKPLYIGSASYSTRTWEAILETGGMDVLELELIENMEVYYFQIHLLVDHMKKLESLCIRQLLPNLDKDKSEFYNTNTKKLNEKYKWYIQSLASIQTITKKILDENEKLLKTLRSHIN